MPHCARLVFCALAFALSIAATAAMAGEDATFYAGKTVRVIVGSPPGATYDIWA